MQQPILVILCLLLACPDCTLRAGSRDEDSRNRNTPDQNTHFDLRTYATRDEWEAKKWRLRRQILSAAGLLPMPVRKPVNAYVVERDRRNGYVIETLRLETMPGYYLGGTLYRPAALGRYPAVLLPHGHWKRGRFEHQPSYSVPALGVNLALQGYVAFAYDMVGYNDTRQTSHSFEGWREQLWSFNPLGLQLWNSIRSLDYLVARHDVDGRRLAITGASGGGTQTFLIAAIDDRITFSSPVNMVSAHMQGGDPCEEAPNLRIHGANNVEFAALAAPKPMLVVSCSRDWTRNTPIEEFPALQHIYSLYGRADRVANAHFDAEHNYNRASREALYPFLARYTRPNASSKQIYWDTALPDLNTFFRPARVDMLQDDTGFLLTRPGIGDRIPAVLIPGRGDHLTVVVHSHGSEAARNSAVVREILQRGNSVLLIDVFQTGAARCSRDRSGRWFLSYNQGDDANRVQDILTALSFAYSRRKGKLKLIGLDEAAGLWCVFAAAVASVAVEVTAVLGSFTGSDEDFHHSLFVPGIQRAGGLPAAMKLLKNAHLHQ